MAKAKKEGARKRSPMQPATERMRVLAQALRTELEQWPSVTVKRSFGMMLAYRGKTVFCALPDTKRIYHDDAIMLKFGAEKPALVQRIEADPHFIPASLDTGRNSRSESRKWRFFLLRDDADVHAAIEWLAEAYQLARGRRS
ncbi:hypothetical protein DYQ86_18195 [Acidobacteria bacterium AB60]|nr:hypothetical protein DYQ86_18195 [Acidobacteria bacterium AB60]